MKAKLKDVAALAGVAPNTASTILNRRPNSWASKATEKRVFAAAKKLGYKPSRAAVDLRLGSYRTVGLVIPDLHNPFFIALADLIEQALQTAGYDLILEHARADLARETYCFSAILERQVDAVAYVLSDVETHRAFLRQVFAQGKPAVALTSEYVEEPLPVDSVLVDFRRGLREAVDHLCALGHRHFVFLSALAVGHDDSNRPEAFQQLLASRQIPAENIHILSCGHDLESAYAAFRDFLKTHRGHRPTALIALNDLAAIAAMRSAYETGLSVPEDLSVVGVDNIPFGACLPRQLSTIAQPLKKMATATTELLLARLKAAERLTPPVVRNFQTHFLDKETTAPVERKA